MINQCTKNNLQKKGENQNSFYGVPLNNKSMVKKTW